MAIDGRFNAFLFVCLTLLLSLPSVLRADEALTSLAQAPLEKLAEKGLVLGVTYTGDVISNVRGGRRRATSYLDNLDLIAEVRLHELLSPHLGTVFLYALHNQGGDPSTEDIGDLQFVDNIEAADSFKLYEAWYEHMVLDGRISLLAGLYDANAEFDLIESALVFIHSSFGIGAELAASGRNGPSIFPATSLATRLRFAWSEELTAQIAVLEGTAGSVRDPRGTQITFDDGEGVLLLAEVAWLRGDSHDGEGDDQVRRRRERRVGRGWGELPYRSKVAVGVWHYTARFPELGSSRSIQSIPGAYLLADVDISAIDPLGATALSVFGRIGFADERVFPLQMYAGGGLVYTGLLPGRPQDRLGFGVAAAVAGGPSRDQIRQSGVRPAKTEVALEWTYRAQIFSWLALQPDLQLVLEPGAVQAEDAVVLGLRFEVGVQ